MKWNTKVPERIELMISSRYCLLAAFIFLMACSPEKSSSQKQEAINPYESALPHGKSLPSEKLSQEDQQKLKAASGRQAEILPISELEWMMDSLGGRLNILNFWSLDCPRCLANNRLLDEVQAFLAIRHYGLPILMSMTWSGGPI